MSLTSAIRGVLQDGDVRTLREAWARFFAKMPQPADDEEAAVVLHQARTGAESVALEKRLYSHAWLMERGLRSNLPDELRPPAQQVRPRIVAAVGVAVATTSRRADRLEEAKAIEKVMARAAGDMVRDGIHDRARIAPVMWKAREDFIRGRLRRVI